jgi:hypothetical protein
MAALEMPGPAVNYTVPSSLSEVRTGRISSDALALPHARTWSWSGDRRGAGRETVSIMEVT